MEMARRLAKTVVLLTMAAVALLLCLDVAYFFRGSLEEFPTDEQEDKVRRVSAALAAVLVVTELVLAALLRHLGRRAVAGERGTDRPSPPAA